MSFGRPPSLLSAFGEPPQRGSFPLDHDGDCKLRMKAYLDCLRSNAADNGKCRHLSKEYLKCRMENGLMDKDEWENLGLSDLGHEVQAETKTTAAAKVDPGPTSNETKAKSTKDTGRWV